ncbi:hypothetical protein, partial [Pseudomonas sp. FSL R10-2964]|uniref:hypothetical protein n=1 Tax=Pseudomonas sp. FSL R10-2964 TaxID=2662202 RepID=UPI001C49B056
MYFTFVAGRILSHYSRKWLFYLNFLSIKENMHTQKSLHKAGFLLITSVQGACVQNMAQRTGLEPATPGVTGRYSNRL